MAAGMMNLDPMSMKALSLVVSVIDGVLSFTSILMPGNDKVDKYCMGMIFGLEGSKLLVGVANMM